MVPEVVGSNPIDRPILPLDPASRLKETRVPAIWEEADFDDHELVQVVRDRASGLTAIIALHSTHLGPGAGGTRFCTMPNPPWPCAMRCACRAG